jgi:hypothetical protein
MRRIRGLARENGRRSWPATLGPWLWFSFVAVVITAPLLGTGYLLLLDYPSGPALPHVPLLPLPSSGDVGSGTPFLALEALLRHVQVWLPDKVLLLAPIVLGGVGLYRLARSRFAVRAAAAAYGATLYVVNPFVADRYLAGHLFFLLGFALLPWALQPVMDLLEEPDRRAGVRVGLWLFGLAAVDLHVAGMYALLVVVAGATALSRRGSIGAAVGLGLGAVLCAYWVLPSLFASPGRGIGAEDLAVYASRPSGVGVLPRLLGLYGFWRVEFAGPAQRIPALYLLLAPILALSIAGAIHALASKTHRRGGLVLVVAAALALLLAGGISFPPTAGVFRFVFDHVSVFRIYREPQKFLAIVVLAYAVFGAVGLEAVVKRSASRSSSARAWLASALAIGVATAYVYTMLWGFWGQVHLTQYPSDWTRADQIMAAEGPGRVLVLPWELYAVWSFTGGRIVANPAPSFFSREVISGDNVGFSTIPTQSVDPFSEWVQDILAHRGKIQELGHLVAPLDVRFVVLLHEVDRSRYSFVERQPDLTAIYRGPRLDLFENLAWRGSVLPLAPVGSSSFAFDDGSEVTQRLISEGLNGPVTGAGFGPVARILPGWRSIAPVRAQYVATGDRCTDGWKLGGQEPVCDLGAVAAFSSPDQSESAWRPAAGARVVGLLVSGLTLLGAVFYVRRKPTKRWGADE